MKKVKIIFASMLLAFTGYSQYEEYIPYIEPYLSAPIESGFFHFITPNNIQAGQLYQWYKITAPDPDNDMVLVKVHTDSVMGMTHYKYQQLYKGLRVEVAGCIEHYQSDGSLNMINAKIADSINKSETPLITSREAIDFAVHYLDRERNMKFAWEDDEWENSAQVESGDSSATYYPYPELLWAIDSVDNVGLIIPGDRYTLAYKMNITTIYPTTETFTLYIDANTGDILKIRTNKRDDGPADIYGYGTQTVDTRWYGGFIYSWMLHANNGTRDILTFKDDGGINFSWNSTGNKVTSNNDNWIGLSSETSPHFFATQAWDYFYDNFGRAGYNWNGLQCKILTQVNGFHSTHYRSAEFNSGNMISQPYLVLCKRTINGVPYDEGWDPSIVIHEYTHGVTQFTADFAYEFESGALSESFSDIFGVGIQALKLDNGNTDWIIGNSIPRPIDLTRHLDFPKLAGNHWTGQFSSGNPIYAVGQPDTYLGENYCENCPLTVDKGGVHINSGIQNKWFYLLANGGSGTNDNDESYNIQGIGIEKALKIAYYNLTGVLMEASQFTDARQGSIWESVNLFGECSIEHQSTVNAWHAVGIGDVHNCQYTLSNPESENEFEMTLYPNPASNLITLRSSHRIEDVIQIVDVNGRVLDEFYSSELMFPINISNLTNGVYFIKTNTIFGIKTLKFVVNH